MSPVKNSGLQATCLLQKRVDDVMALTLELAVAVAVAVVRFNQLLRNNLSRTTAPPRNFALQKARSHNEVSVAFPKTKKPPRGGFLSSLLSCLVAEEAGLSNNPLFFNKINDLHSWVVKTGSKIDTTTATKRADMLAQNFGYFSSPNV